MIMRQGIIDSGIDRKNIFLTTKIQTYDETFQTHLFDLIRLFAEMFSPIDKTYHEVNIEV